MRYDRLMVLWGLAGGLTLGTACNGLDDDDPPIGDDDDDDGVGDDDDDDTDDTDIEDTGPLLEIAYDGEGVVSDGETYAGSESFLATLGPNTNTPTVLCRWTWDVNGTLPSTAELECTDDEGNPCEFSMEVDLTNGSEDEGDCAEFELAVDHGTEHYGFVEDYGGLGPALMYYLPELPDDPVNFPAVWYALGEATYDSATGELDYFAPFGLYQYP